MYSSKAAKKLIKFQSFVTRILLTKKLKRLISPGVIKQFVPRFKSTPLKKLTDTERLRVNFRGPLVFPVCISYSNLKYITRPPSIYQTRPQGLSKKRPLYFNGFLLKMILQIFFRVVNPHRLLTEKQMTGRTFRENSKWMFYYLKRNRTRTP